MKRNIELLTKVRDQILREPDKLNMDHWGEVPLDGVELKVGVNKIAMPDIKCGTSACIAGWATQIHGDKFLLRIASLADWTGEESFFADEVVSRNGRQFYVEVRAAALLGLDDDESNFLFHLEDSEALPALDRFIAGDTLAEVRTALDSIEENSID